MLEKTDKSGTQGWYWKTMYKQAVRTIKLNEQSVALKKVANLDFL